MHDESRPLIHTSQLSNSHERRIATQRQVKRKKAQVTRVSWEELSHSHASENLRILKSTLQFSLLKPCVEHPTLPTLPTEIVHHILDFMPFVSVGRLSQTSLSLNRMVASWLDTSRAHSRISSLVIVSDFSESQLTGKLTLPIKLHRECHNLGVLLKCLTCLVATGDRLDIFYRFTQSLNEVLRRKIPKMPPTVLSSMNGVILHALIAGWDKKECRTVFHLLNTFNKVTSDANGFLGRELPFGFDKISLRVHIRSMFLDFAAAHDTNMWVNIVFDEFQVKTPRVAAKLLLLLYTPLSSDGESLWNFSVTDVNTSYCLSNYKMLAEALVRLTCNNMRNSMSFQEIFVIITQEPTEWPLKAQASLLLCTHFIDNKPVTVYFRGLASQQNDDAAIVLLTEVLTVAGDFISLLVWDSNLLANYRGVLNLFRNALNAGWGYEERKCIVTEVWKDVKLLAGEMLEDARVQGSIDELRDFIETWTNISIQVTV